MNLPRLGHPLEQAQLQECVGPQDWLLMISCRLVALHPQLGSSLTQCLVRSRWVDACQCHLRTQEELFSSSPSQTLEVAREANLLVSSSKQAQVVNIQMVVEEALHFQVFVCQAVRCHALKVEDRQHQEDPVAGLLVFLALEAKIEFQMDAQVMRAKVSRAFPFSQTIAP